MNESPRIDPAVCRTCGDGRGVEDGDTITLRHIPGSCCPEKDCSVGSWDGKHCRSCGADCAKCLLNGLVED